MTDTAEDTAPEPALSAKQKLVGFGRALVFSPASLQTAGGSLASSLYGWKVQRLLKARKPKQAIAWMVVGAFGAATLDSILRSHRTPEEQAKAVEKVGPRGKATAGLMRTVDSIAAKVAAGVKDPARSSGEEARRSKLAERIAAETVFGSSEQDHIAATFGAMRAARSNHPTARVVPPDAPASQIPSHLISRAAARRYTEGLQDPRGQLGEALRRDEGQFGSGR